MAVKIQRAKKSKANAKSTIVRRLTKHLGTDPSALPVLQQEFAGYDRPNLHLAIEELVQPASGNVELFGLVRSHDYESVHLSKLSRHETAAEFQIGPVEYLDVGLPGDQKLACVKRGVYLFHFDGKPVAMLVSPPAYMHQENPHVEVMATDQENAEKFVRQLSRRTRHGSAYRGHVISVEQDCHGSTVVQYHTLPKISRDEIILPEDLLRRIERHTLSFTKHAERLRAAGRHLKRGILLHGPPGTGKTLSAMYLAAQMPGRTVVLITGRGTGSIETAGQVARLLEPSTIILEDVDLIGTQRESQTIGANALLFELLNQMDGLAEDIDVLFVLTTNRPDVLEPALAARPGRIDQAIEVPLPDADCRRRLFDLYGRGLQLKVTDRNRLIERTAGVSGAFIKELLRKAAVYAAEDDGSGPLTVRDRHVDEALAELLTSGGLTRTLLGATCANGDR